MKSHNNNNMLQIFVIPSISILLTFLVVFCVGIAFAEEVVPKISGGNLPVTALNSLMKTAADPPMKTAADPPMKTAADPPMKTAADPPMKTVADPPMKTVADPPMKTVADPPMKTVADPPMKTVADPPMKTVADPPMKTVADPPMKTVVDPPMKTVADPPMELNLFNNNFYVTENGSNIVITNATNTSVGEVPFESEFNPSDNNKDIMNRADGNSIPDTRIDSARDGNFENTID